MQNFNPFHQSKLSSQDMQSFSSDLPKIKEFVELSGQQMLEIGCGDGRLSSLLANHVKSLTAIDPDQAMITRAAKEISGVDFRVGYGEKLDFTNDAYDIVLFSYSLHHQDCVKALDEAKRVVKENGSILIVEPSTESEYTQFVSLFQADEINRLRTTLAYIQSGIYDISREEVYVVKYHYKDAKELYDHFIDGYMAANDTETIEKMDALLGSKKNARPIAIKDKVNIFLLTF